MEAGVLFAAEPGSYTSPVVETKEAGQTHADHRCLVIEHLQELTCIILQHSQSPSLVLVVVSILGPQVQHLRTAGE